MIALASNEGESPITKVANAEGIAKYQPTETAKIATSQTSKAILQGGEEKKTAEQYKTALEAAKKKISAGEYTVGEVVVLPIYKNGTIIDGVDVGGQIVPKDNTNKPSQVASYTYQPMQLLVPQYEGDEAVYVPASDIATAVSAKDKNFSKAYEEIQRRTNEANNKLKSGYHRRDGNWEPVKGYGSREEGIKSVMKKNKVTRSEAVAALQAAGKLD